MRVSLYDDDGRTLLKEAYEKFEKRCDGLVKRARYPRAQKLEEHFLPGRLFSLRQFTHVVGRKRVYHFFMEGRQDGLFLRSDCAQGKVVERFKNRFDGLSYRSVSLCRKQSFKSPRPQYTLPCGEFIGEFHINKMTLKFSRNINSYPSDGALAKRTFYIQEDAIRSQYHYKHFGVTRHAFFYAKERNIQPKSNSLVRKLCSRIRLHSEDKLAAVDRTSQSGLDTTEAHFHDDALNAERECLTDIRRSHLEISELLKSRRAEEKDVIIDRPVVEKSPKTSSQGNADENMDNVSTSDAQYVASLTPFLNNSGADSLDLDRARCARDSCLKSLKQRLIERANIIMSRLNDENSNLAKRQMTFPTVCML